MPIQALLVCCYHSKSASYEISLSLSLSPSCWVLLLFSFKHCPAQLLLLLYLCTCHNPKGLTATLSSCTLHPCKAELKLYSIILLIAFRWQASLVPLLLSPPRAPQQAAADWLWIRRVARSRSSCKPCGKMRDPARLAGTGNTPPHTFTPGPHSCPYLTVPWGELLVTSIVWNAENIVR